MYFLHLYINKYHHNIRICATRGARPLPQHEPRSARRGRYRFTKPNQRLLPLKLRPELNSRFLKEDSQLINNQFVSKINELDFF